MGHEEQFSPPTVSARYVIRQETFAGTHDNGRDAPKAAIRALRIELAGSTQNKHSETCRHGAERGDLPARRPSEVRGSASPC